MCQGLEEHKDCLPRQNRDSSPFREAVIIRNKEYTKYTENIENVHMHLSTVGT